MSNLWKAGYTFTQDLTTKYGPFYNEIHMNLKYHETWHPQNLFLTKNSSLRVLSLKNLYISNLTLVLTLRTMTYEEEQPGFFFVQTMVSGNQLKHRSDFGNLKLHIPRPASSILISFQLIRTSSIELLGFYRNNA